MPITGLEPIDYGLGPGTKTGDVAHAAFQRVERNFARVGAAIDAIKGTRITCISQFPVVGNGVADDSDGWAEALATGKSILDDIGGTYRITHGLSFAGEGQRIIGIGTTRFNLAGSADFFAFGGNRTGQGISDATIAASAQTGGHVFAINAAHRISLQRLRVLTPWSLADIRKANEIAFQDVWCLGFRGPYNVRWSGSAVDRSDNLRFVNVIWSADAATRGDGLLWDGNCNSLTCHTLGMVQCGYGLRIRNTDGGPPPLIARLIDLEVDFPLYDAVRIEAGTDFELTSPYLHGSTNGSGVNVVAGVAADAVRVLGGKSTGHARYGLESDAAAFQNAVACYFSANALGDTAGVWRAKTPRFEVDPNFYMQIGGLSPVLSWDPNDADGFIRASNLRYFNVGGVTRFSVSDVRASAAVPVQYPSYTVATLPVAATHPRSLVYVSDDVGGATLAMSNGTNWLRLADRAVISAT